MALPAGQYKGVSLLACHNVVIPRGNRVLPGEQQIVVTSEEGRGDGHVKKARESVVPQA